MRVVVVVRCLPESEEREGGHEALTMGVVPYGISISAEDADSAERGAGRARRRAENLRLRWTSRRRGRAVHRQRAAVGDRCTRSRKLLTRPTPDGSGIEALVRYAEASALYAVEGLPMHAFSEGPDEGVHDQAHAAMLTRLATPEPVEGGNELPVYLRG